MVHPNETLIRNAFNAFMRGDVEAARSVFDPNVIWRVSGRGALSGEFRGFEEVVRWGGQLFERSGGTIREELHEVVANDSVAFQWVTYTATRGNTSIEDESVNVFRIQKGKVVECQVYFAKTEEFDRFWS
jgi:ketosteroid isomerase-like protein